MGSLMPFHSQLAQPSLVGLLHRYADLSKQATWPIPLSCALCFQCTRLENLHMLFVRSQEEQMQRIEHT